MAVQELKRLPGSKVEEVAALIHQLAQDVDKQKRQAFAATFASMSAEEADAFQRVIDEACKTPGFSRSRLKDQPLFISVVEFAERPQLLGSLIAFETGLVYQKWCKSSACI